MDILAPEPVGADGGDTVSTAVVVCLLSKSYTQLKSMYRHSSAVVNGVTGAPRSGPCAVKGTGVPVVGPVEPKNPEMAVKTDRRPVFTRLKKPSGRQGLSPVDNTPKP